MCPSLLSLPVSPSRPPPLTPRAPLAVGTEYENVLQALASRVDDGGEGGEGGAGAAAEAAARRREEEAREAREELATVRQELAEARA